jgi:hypothetical protein
LFSRDRGRQVERFLKKGLFRGDRLFREVCLCSRRNRLTAQDPPALPGKTLLSRSFFLEPLNHLGQLLTSLCFFGALSLNSLLQFTQATRNVGDMTSGLNIAGPQQRGAQEFLSCIDEQRAFRKGTLARLLVRECQPFSPLFDPSPKLHLAILFDVFHTAWNQQCQ